ncbi:MAG: PAS domain-containing sensor histidine kinase, partial [Rectinemataceae bacterium]
EIKMAIRGKQEYDTEYRVVWPDREVRHIKAIAIVQRDHISGKAVRMIGTNWDITKIRIAEKEKLDDSEKRYRSIFNGSPDGIMIADAETRMIMFANPRQCEMLGYAEGELTAMTLGAIYPKDSVEEPLTEYESLLRGEKDLVQGIRCLKKNGETFYSDISLGLMTIDNRDCIVGFFRDITKRREAEILLKEALIRAEAANRLKTEFINTISHEIRTPLNGIVGFGSLLSDPNLTLDERQQYNAYIEASGNRLINTISDYMDVSLIASGNIEINCTIVSVSSMMNELKAKYQSFCDVKEVGLKLCIPDDQIHCTLITDGQLLRKIISCLLDNAIKFTSQGSITFGYSVNDSTIEIFVNDTGVGVSPESQELIFEPFVQEDSTNTRVHQGSGLGLYIIKNYLKLLGGEMCLETIKGKGTEVLFSLPMEPGFTEERNPSRRRSDRSMAINEIRT